MREIFFCLISLTLCICVRVRVHAHMPVHVWAYIIVYVPFLYSPLWQKSSIIMITNKFELWPNLPWLSSCSTFKEGSIPWLLEELGNGLPKRNSLLLKNQEYESVHWDFKITIFEFYTALQTFTKVSTKNCLACPILW